jgi:hypothetical protein
MKAVTSGHVIAGVVLALAFIVPSSRAQEPRRLITPDSIPRELASALIAAGGFGNDPQILVGAMPEWIANRLSIPSGARVLGSAFLGTTAVAVVALPAAPDSLLAQVKGELLRRGWTNPPPPPYYGGGFRPASMAPSDAPLTRVTLCGDQQNVLVTAARSRGTATNIVYRVNTAAGFSICRPPPFQAIRPMFPTLYNPPTANDARTSGDCSSSFNGSSGTGATLRTSMTADALLDHYARQMQDSGWMPSGDKVSVLGRAWTKPDSTGAPIEAVVTVAVPPRDPGCRELNLQVRTVRKP